VLGKWALKERRYGSGFQALAPEAIAECIRSGGVWELAAIAIFK
jgi:hypothetical protein